MRILTWNIAGSDLSSVAPSSWSLDDKIKKIVQIVTNLKPDLIAFQEVESPDLRDMLQLEGYSGLKEHPSHSGYTLFLFKKELEEFIVDVFTIGPSIGCTLFHPEVGVMAVMACHLPPFGKNKEIRADQLTYMVEYLRERTSHFIIVGDMNMRMAENKIVSQLKLKDAFLLAGSPKTFRFSWDGYKNPFHSNGHPFTCRFDRIFLHNFESSNFKFVGHHPVSMSTKHFLSDHFGLVVDINF